MTTSRTNSPDPVDTLRLQTKAVKTLSRGTRSKGAHRAHAKTGGRDVRLTLLAWQICALGLQVVAVYLSRRSHGYEAGVVNFSALATAYSSALWVLTSPQLTRKARNAAVLCLGLTPTLLWRSTNPLLFTGFDEQLHMRTLGDILSSHRLFEANPLLQVSPRYPGVELVTVLVHQTGVPTMASAFIVVMLCRIVLVTVLCDAVEQLTGNMRAGGLAVAVYAVGPQFIFFNSQFSYQTLAIPLALSAVSLIARSRTSDDPLILFFGATVCLLGVAMAHHVTSFMTAAFLLLWMLFQRGPARLRVAYGALAAIATTVAWMIVQRSLLEEYFGPIISDVGGSAKKGEKREAFKDSAGTPTPLRDTLLLLYYAAVVVLVVGALAMLALHWWRRGDRHVLRWNPRLLIFGLTAMIPVTMAARVIPKGGELFDRGSSFLFFPLSLTVAIFATRLWWPDSRDPPLRPPGRLLSGLQAIARAAGNRLGLSRRPWAGRSVAVIMASLMFVASFVLGGGPFWARLPGPYLVSADTRSMDAEVLAASEWARDALPSGSRIVGDRVGSDLLASKAGVWPVMKGGGVNAPPLYFADDFGLTEQDIVRSLRLRFLYVDRRLATHLPHFGSYFESGEPGDGKVLLTDAQLAKFDNVPGIKEIYRHGPISIYDLAGLGVPEQRNGWYGETPRVGLAEQLVLGVFLGLLFVFVPRSRLWPRLVRLVKRLRRAAGPALLGGIALAGTAIVSATLLLLGIWMTPLAFASAGLFVVLSNPRRAASAVRRAAGAVGGNVTARRVRITATFAAPLAVIVAVSVSEAAAINIVEVRRILDDPAAIHIPVKDGTGPDDTAPPAPPPPAPSTVAPPGSTGAAPPPAGAPRGIPTREFLIGRWGIDGDCALALDLRPDGTTDGPFGNWSYSDGVLDFAEVPKVDVTAIDANTMESTDDEGKKTTMTRCP